MVLLEVAVFCVYRLERAATAQARAPEAETRSDRRAAPSRRWSRSSGRPICSASARGSACCRSARRSLYFEQAHIVSTTVHGAGAQTRIFASIDLAVSLLTLATQISPPAGCSSASAQELQRARCPLVYVVGFAALAVSPSLVVVMIFQVVQRWMNFAIANPARQVFFTVVDREEKYKAKNLIDVVIYRGSDALYGWVFDSLQAVGTEAWRDRAVRAAGNGRLACVVDGVGTDAGTSGRTARRRGGARRLKWRSK